MAYSVQHSLIIRQLATQEYEPVWQAMKAFTDSRDDSVVDELWLVEHSPVFTQGQADKPEHLLIPSDIPVIKSDHGGQITYNVPGDLALKLTSSLIVDIFLGKIEKWNYLKSQPYPEKEDSLKLSHQQNLELFLNPLTKPRPNW